MSMVVGKESPRRRWVRCLGLACAAALVSTLVVLTGCSADPSEQTTTVGRLSKVTADVDGQRVLGLYRTDIPVKGVVIYFHGLDRDETVIEMDSPHKELTQTLADAGYPVVASDASGNAYGNEQSQHNYAQLVYAATEKFKTRAVFFVSESMGTVAAVNLMAQESDLRVRGLAGISPLLNLTSGPPDYVTAAHEVNPQYRRTSPIDLPPTALRGKNFRFYYSKTDQLVDSDTNVIAFERRFGREANISTVECTGEHMDKSCIQGKDILAWFRSLGNE